MKVPAGLISGETSLLDLEMMPSVPTYPVFCVFALRGECTHASSSSYKDAIPIRLGPHS